MSTLPLVWRWVLGILAVLVTGLCVWKLKGILGAAAAALILAYVLEPAVEWLERHKIPRPLGVVLLALGGLGSVLVVFGLAVPVIVRQTGAFIDSANLPGLTDPSRWPPEVRTFLENNREEIDRLREEFLAWLKANAANLLARIGSLVMKLTSSVVGMVVAILNVVLVPVMAYYFVVDYRPMVRGAAALVPHAWRPTTFRLAGEIDRVLRAFLRGQAFVAAALGLMYAIGLSLCGTPLGILIGLVAGALSLVPYLGLAVGIIPALLLNLLQHQSLGRAIAVVLVFVIAQTIEGYVLTPRLVGEAVGLHPVIVILAVLAGGVLFGFAGILLAVPVAAAASVFWHEGLTWYKQSSYFLEGAPPDPPADEPPHEK